MGYRGIVRIPVAALALWWSVAAPLGAQGTTAEAAAGERLARRGVPAMPPAVDAALDSLLQRAIERRQRQLADSTLLSYQAEAHGFLAFLAQLGEGTLIPPRVVQSEELALTISWWQPGRSAQRLVGRRDTTLLPAAVSYYRDRYGVVLDNLPDRIRLGDGQDVRDVPHPLAPGGALRYEFARAAPLRIRIPGREIVVDEVTFRPYDATQPAAIGSVYLDRETAAVVRLSMTFTRAAIRDQRIETLVVTLENGLVRERYWLPRRQEVEVSRGSTWLDLPARGIVRGRWEIGGYTVNERIPPVVQQLPRWSSAPRDSLRAHRFEGRVVDVLPPEIQLASSEEVVRARVQAEAAVRAALLTRPATATVTGRGVSDLLRVTRAEGLALGVGASHRSRAGVVVSARARYGFADRVPKWHLSLAPVPAFGRVPTVRLFVEDEYREVGIPERAGVTNSLGTLLFASDLSNPVRTTAIGLDGRLSPRSPFTWRVALERDRGVPVAGWSLRGTFQPTIAAYPVEGVRSEWRGSGGWVGDMPSAARGIWTVAGSAGWYRGTTAQRIPPDVRTACNPCALSPVAVRTVRPLVARMEGLVQVTKPLAGDRAVVVHVPGGLVAGRDLPPQWLVYAGGAQSAPGYLPQQFGSRALVAPRLEFRQPVPAPAIPLRRFGTAPPHVTLVPFVQVVATASGTADRPTAAGLYPSAGAGLLFFFDLLRVDVARGLRDGRWRLNLDIDRSFWGML
jgi:hypothetical protein